jgi:large subunit ribosomal protein L6
MSRVGQKVILIPDKVKVTLEGTTVKIEGPKGKAAYRFPSMIEAELKDKSILIKNKNKEDRQSRAFHGLARSLVAGHIEGVDKGFKKQLEIHGVGFKAAVQGKNLALNLGFSHPILYPIPDGIKVTVTDNVNILVEGSDKQKVGAVAADIRAFYPPEPYKGKGIRYVGEHILRKEGKTAQSK